MPDWFDADKLLFALTVGWVCHALWLQNRLNAISKQLEMVNRKLHPELFSKE